MEDGRWRPFTRRSGKSVRPTIVDLSAFKYRRTPETMHRTCWLTYLMMVAVAVGSSGCQSGGLWKPHLPWSKKSAADDSTLALDSPDGSDSTRRDSAEGGWLFEDSDGRPKAPIDEKSTLLAQLAPENVWKRLTTKQVTLLDRRQARAELRRGEDLARQGDYQEAIEPLKAAAGAWPGSSAAHDAQFLLGEAYFFTDQYAKARTTFSEMLKERPNSPYLDKISRRQFAIARYWEERQEQDPTSWYALNLTDAKVPLRDVTGESRALYNSIWMNDPTGPLADDSLMAIANGYFVAGRYENADYYYNILRRDYPKSEHMVNAYLLGIQAKLRNYEGPDYDGKPLTGAKDLIAQFKLQFPREAQEQRERLAKVEKEVNVQLASRDMHLAHYFDRRQDYRAARIYYEKVARDYPHSSFAEESAERLVALRDKPDNAPDYVPLLTEVFESDRKKRY